MSLLKNKTERQTLKRALQENVANTVVILSTVWLYATQHAETVRQAARHEIRGNSLWSSDR